MKNILLVIALFACAITQSLSAQTDTASVFKKVVTSYFDLKNALTRDEARRASIDAGELQRAIDSVPMDNLSPPQHELWSKYYSRLHHEAGAIHDGKNLRIEREQFKELSADMFRVLSDLKINTTDLYYQYCTMANAYWVSEKSTVDNPYYGQAMPTCGVTKDTLKATK